VKDKKHRPFLQPASPTPNEQLLIEAVHAFWDASEKERKTFYLLLTNLPWLTPEVRRAILHALDISPEAIGRAVKEHDRLQLKQAIDQREQELRASGLRRGVRNQALNDVAAKRGMDPDVIKKRLQRDRRRTRC
jgi:DNA-directed RNA polymerase specialized sigma24 family protein